MRLQMYKSILQTLPSNKHAHIIAVCCLLDFLSASLNAGEVKVLSEEEQTLLKTQPTLLKKIPMSMQAKWGVAPVATLLAPGGGLYSASSGKSSVSQVPNAPSL